MFLGCLLVVLGLVLVRVVWVVFMVSWVRFRRLVCGLLRCFFVVDWLLLLVFDLGCFCLGFTWGCGSWVV